MKKNKLFFSENLLISIAGHLLFGALMLTSLYMVLGQPKLVVSDRVEIFEIDLSKVTVTRDKTEVFNTAAPEVKTEVVDNKPTPKAPAVPEPEIKPIEKPSLIEDTAKKTDDKKPVAEKDKPKEKQPQPDKPRERTVVRVNRETTSLNRTMTVSVIDALRVAMTRCWVIDQTRPDVADLRVVVHLTLYENGMVKDLWFEDAVRADSDAGFAYVVETIRTAVGVCQPFSMLPKPEYDEWKNIQLTFYPQAAKIQ